MRPYIITILIFLSCSLSVMSQQKGKNYRGHRHKHARKSIETYPISPGPKVTNKDNTGSSDGTMPDNNDPGKVTTNTKGKNGPSNTSTMQMKPARGKGGPVKMNK